jgi:hypothetical protein
MVEGTAISFGLLPFSRAKLGPSKGTTHEQGYLIEETQVMLALIDRLGSPKGDCGPGGVPSLPEGLTSFLVTVVPVTGLVGVLLLLFVAAHQERFPGGGKGGRTSLRLDWAWLEIENQDIAPDQFASSRARMHSSERFGRLQRPLSKIAHPASPRSREPLIPSLTRSPGALWKQRPLNRNSDPL